MTSYLRRLGAQALGPSPEPPLAPAVEPLFAPGRRSRLEDSLHVDESEGEEEQGALTELEGKSQPGIRAEREASAMAAPRPNDAVPPDNASEVASLRALIRNLSARISAHQGEQAEDQAAPEPFDPTRIAQMTNAASDPSSPQPSAPDRRARSDDAHLAVTDATSRLAPPAPPQAPTSSRLDQDETLREVLGALRAATSARAERPAQRDAATVETPQVVRVTIGRVDVRLPAVSAPPAPPRRREPGAPRGLTLEDYLSRKPGAHR